MISKVPLLWGAGLGTAALVGGGLWYARPELQRQAAAIRDVPAIHDSVNSISQRMEQAEGQIKSWVNDRDGLRDQMAQMEANLKAGLGAQQRQLRNTRDAIMARVHLELAQHDSAVNSRLARWEEQREQDQAAIAGMRRQLAGLERSVGRQQERLIAVETNASADKQVLEQQVAGVRDEEIQNRGEVRDLARSLETRRIDFEVSKNHSRQLAPGISLCVTRTDVAHRRVDGWMWIMPDRKTIWLRGQGAMQPVIYYSAVDGKRREVVITHTTNDGAVGYLLLPASGAHEVAYARPAARP